MRVTIKRLRLVLLVAAVAVSVGDLRETLYAFPDDCAEICPSSDCNTRCYENEMEFQNGNTISCRDYGVYDTSQMCCGDGVCSEETGETLGTCYADCYVPGTEPQTTFLVNGSLNPTMPDWMWTGSPLYNAIAATYNGQAPIQFFWAQNSFGEVTWPGYSGIDAGAQLLANEVNALPAGEIVNLVGHSHGGNVLIRSTHYLDRPVKHLIELATPVNWDLPKDQAPRYTAGDGAQWRCTASSWADVVQLLGASPPQVTFYFLYSFWAAQEFEEASFYLGQGDYENWAIHYALYLAFALEADYFWGSSKIEWYGATIPFNALDHSMMHEPLVWNALPSFCKVGG